jgi:uncharacterized protein DUF4157
MALKNKTHEIEKPSTKQRPPQQITLNSPEHQRPSNPIAALQRATSSSPSSLEPADILALQRTIGNRAVQRMLSGPTRQTHVSTSSAGPMIQAKLTIGPAGDQYEQEADRVARQVMSMDAQPANPTIQRASDEDLQTSSLQCEQSPEAVSAAPGIETAIQQARGGGQPLPEAFRSRMERAFGADFGGVRVHTDAQADSLNRVLQARAFTNNQDVFFQRGEYDPASPGGQELIAHELTHVLQQGGGQAPQTSGAPVALLQSKIKSAVSSEIQSTQAQLQMKKGYRVLAGKLTGNNVAVLEKADHHISIVDPNWTWEFDEFHVTFDNNVQGRQAHFFYDEDATFKANPNHPQNVAYREDLKNNKKDKGGKNPLPAYEKLRELSQPHATAFVKELADAEAAELKRIEDEKKRIEEEKKKAEEAKKKAITETIAAAIKNGHNGFQLATKQYHLANQQNAVARGFQDLFPGSTATGSPGDANPAKTFVPMNRIKVDLRLKDFTKEGEAAYTKLVDHQNVLTLKTVKFQ